MAEEKYKRLQEVQETYLKNSSEKINEWKKFKEDYLHLKNRLSTIADELEHDIMVPFGSVAFMPGKLVHTNEILVLLGDNLFVERSAKQASEILDRRIANCDSHLENYIKEQKHLTDWQSATKAIKESENDLVEIKEPYDEIAEKNWRENRRKNYKSEFKKPQETELEMPYEEFMNKLAQLEIDEKSTSRVQRLKTDEPSTTTSQNSSTFKFSSPADIYAHYQSICEPKPLKSILKNSQKELNIVENKTESTTLKNNDVKSKELAKHKNVKFEPDVETAKSVENPAVTIESSAAVIESPAIENTVVVRDPTKNPAIKPPEKPKRVSVFKANQLSRR